MKHEDFLKTCKESAKKHLNQNNYVKLNEQRTYIEIHCKEQNKRLIYKNKEATDIFNKLVPNQLQFHIEEYYTIDQAEYLYKAILFYLATGKE